MSDFENSNPIYLVIKDVSDANRDIVKKCISEMDRVSEDEADIVFNTISSDHVYRSNRALSRSEAQDIVNQLALGGAVFELSETVPINDDIKFCTQCGKENTWDAVYCKYCGALINGGLEDNTTPAETKKNKNHSNNKKLPYKLKAVLAVVIIVVVALVVNTVYVKNKRKYIDLYNIAQDSEDVISKYFRMDPDQSHDNVHVYIIDERGVTITYNEEKEGSVNVSLILMTGDASDEDTKYIEKHYSIAGHKLGDKFSEIEADNKFKKIYEMDHINDTKIAMFEEIANNDGLLTVNYDTRSGVINLLVYQKYDGLHDDIISGMNEDILGNTEINNDDIATTAEEPSETSDVDKAINYDELKDKIMIYCSMYYETNNIAADIDSEDNDKITIRVYDPYTDSEATNYGFFDYYKNTGIWKNANTGEEIDFDAANEHFNETLAARSGMNEAVSNEYYTSDADRYGYTADYVCVNSPSDGYANIRYAPDIDSDIKYQWENGVILDYLGETVDSSDGRHWHYVGFYYWDDYDGYGMPRYMDGYISSKVCNVY